MRFTLKISLITIQLCMLTSCATIYDASNERAEAYKYDSTRSKASNVVDAAKMDNVKDVEVGNALYNLLSTSDMNWGEIDPHPGDSNYSTMSLKYLLVRWGSSFYQENYQRNILIAWMPSELASSKEEAQLKMTNMLKEAALKGLTQQGSQAHMSYEYTSEQPFWYNTLPRLSKSFDFKCNEAYSKQQLPPNPIERIKKCDFTYTIQPPEGLVKTPTFLPQNPSGKSYFFSSRGAYTSELYLTPTLAQISDRSIQSAYAPVLQKISKSLPEWFFLYKTQNNYNQQPRVLFQQGKSLFFIQPQEK